MDEDTGGVDAVVGISPEVVATVHDDAFPACGGHAFGDHEAGKSGTDDQEVGG